MAVYRHNCLDLQNIWVLPHFIASYLKAIIKHMKTNDTKQMFPTLDGTSRNLESSMELQAPYREHIEDHKPYRRRVSWFWHDGTPHHLCNRTVGCEVHEAS
jgi:hypothetical protein